MSIQERIFELLNEISKNQTRNNDVFDNNMSHIKSVIMESKLTSEQMSRFLKWCNEDIVDFKKLYESNLGVYSQSEFENPILQLAFELDENNIQ